MILSGMLMMIYNGDIDGKLTFNVELVFIVYVKYTCTSKGGPYAD